MGIEPVRELRQRWFGHHGNTTNLLQYLNRALDKIGFTEAYLTSCLSRTRSRASPKVIKDNVWGMIEVDGTSVRLLDATEALHYRTI